MQSGNSTIGDNGKFYFHGENQRGFYGNQYVKTTKLTTIGSSIKQFAKKATPFTTGAVVLEGAYKDYTAWRDTGYTDGYHTAKAATSLATSYMGLELGICIGSVIGSTFGGVGAIPGAIIGGVIGGVIGGYYGAIYGEHAIDKIYGY